MNISPDTPGSRYFDVEGVPVWVSPTFQAVAFDGPEPRPFPAGSAFHNGTPISREEFERLCGE